MTKALVLDCDGVLADTEEFGHLVAFNRTFEEFGYPFRWSKAEYADLLQVAGGKERVRRYAELTGADLGYEGDIDAAAAAIHRRKTEIYVEMVDGGEVPGRPGIRRLVKQALAAGWIVAVATTTAPQSARSVLRSVLGPEDLEQLSGVFAGDVVPAKKPAPDIYLLAVSELGLDPATRVGVEDSAVGATAAHAAGLRHVVTLSSFTGNEEFPYAETVVDSLGDPGIPVQVKEGRDLRDADGLISVDSLELVLQGT